MKTFVLALTALGLLTSTLAAPATAQPTATGGTIQSQPALSADRSGTAKPSNSAQPVVSTDAAKRSKPSPKLEYLKIDMKNVQVNSF